LKIRRWVLDPGLSSQDNKAGDDNKENGANFDNPDRIREPVGIFCIENQC
jgi:hypothetical protein